MKTDVGSALLALATMRQHQEEFDLAKPSRTADQPVLPDLDGTIFDVPGVGEALGEGRTFGCKV